MHFAAGSPTRKARNLAHSSRCVLSARCCSLDLVVEGVVSRVVDEGLLGRVVEEYLAKYAWPVNVVDGALVGDGAPTAGPPPYDVYRLEPVVAFALPTDETLAPARWEF
jgi:hypothetical protein